MTLKEKIAEEILVPISNQGFYIDWDKVEKFEKLFDKHAIEFGDWLLINPNLIRFEYSYEDLLEMFKKEKGL
jgi:hypothetical protein